MTGGSFNAAARHALEDALRAGQPLLCPECNIVLNRQDVAQTKEVSYVRHRVWLLCPQCRRSASVDVKR
jgi:hypothetical protein